MAGDEKRQRSSDSQSVAKRDGVAAGATGGTRFGPFRGTVNRTPGGFRVGARGKSTGGFFAGVCIAAAGIFASSLKAAPASLPIKAAMSQGIKVASAQPIPQQAPAQAQAKPNSVQKTKLAHVKSTDKQLKLVWSDEFDHDGAPDPANWSFETGGDGFGNDEKQYYTDRRENARVENGMLVIEARKEHFKNREYTSAKLVSKGKGDFAYGRFEFRARVPSGRGTWPAIWMMPTNEPYGDGGWPDNGEIDIMEHVGFDPNVIHGSLHCHDYNWMKKEQRTGITTTPNAQTDFHVYSLDWSPEQIDFAVDGKVYYSTRNEQKGWSSWPFDQPFFMIMNLAVGGFWGGQKGIDDSIFPRRLEVDWVRVYQTLK